MSIIRFGCDYCGHPIEVNDDLIGTATLCPSCSGDLEVPGASETKPRFQFQNHKFLLAVVGSTLIFVSLLLIYHPPQANDTGGKSKNGVAITPDTLERWKGEANGSMKNLATNQPGFEKLVRALVFVNSSDDPNDWSGFADIEYVSRRGVTEQTNLLMRFGLVNGIDDTSNVVCFLDGFAMDKRAYEAELGVLRARQHAKAFGDQAQRSH